LEKLTVVQLVTSPQSFMEPYPDPDEVSPSNHILSTIAFWDRAPCLRDYTALYTYTRRRHLHTRRRDNLKSDTHSYLVSVKI